MSFFTKITIRDLGNSFHNHEMRARALVVHFSVVKCAPRPLGRHLKAQNKKKSNNFWENRKKDVSLQQKLRNKKNFKYGTG